MKKWYFKKARTYDGLTEKYLPYISKENHIKAFIVYLDQNPMGYVQYYPVKQYPWENHGLDDELQMSAGIDLFIGDKRYLGKGLSEPMIKRFLQARVLKEYPIVVVDPELKNTRAIHCYRKCGFIDHKTIISRNNAKHLLLVKR